MMWFVGAADSLTSKAAELSADPPNITYVSLLILNTEVQRLKEYFG